MNRKHFIQTSGLSLAALLINGWGNNPNTSLYNKENLPASPFRTDSFDK